MEECILQPPSGRTQVKRNRTNKRGKPGRPTYTYKPPLIHTHATSFPPPCEGHTRMTLRVHRTRHCNGGCHHHYIFWTENVNASLDLWRLFFCPLSALYVHTVFLLTLDVCVCVAWRLRPLHFLPPPPPTLASHFSVLILLLN